MLHMIKKAAADITAAAAGKVKIFVDSADGLAKYKDESGTVASFGAPITLATAQASTSGTSINFSSIPSGTRIIHVMFSGVSTSGSSGLIVQIGDAGGVETSGYNGCASVISGTGIPATTNFSNGFLVVAGGAAADVRYGILTLILMDSSANTWAAKSEIGFSSTVVGWGAGTKSLSQELSSVRITTAGGTDTFDAGSINISYQ